MPFSDITQWASGLYGRNVVVRNADGSIAQFAAGAEVGTETRKFEKTFAGAVFNNVQISQPNLAAASVANVKMIRIESTAFSDVYFQLVVSANPFDASNAAVIDVFAVRALSSRTIEASMLAAKDIALPAGSELYLNISTSPTQFLPYTPTGSEGLHLISIVNQV